MSGPLPTLANTPRNQRGLECAAGPHRGILRLCYLLLWLILIPYPAVAACEGRVISEHIYGEPVCVPHKPQRIVTLEPWLSLGTLHELNAPVIGVPMMGIQDQTLRASVEKAGITDVGHPYQPSIERIIALQPDLIIGTSHAHAQVYGKLSRIAPTLLLDQMVWKRHFLMLADIIGESPAAQDKIRNYESRVAAVRERVPENIRVSVVRVAPLGFQVYLAGPAAYAPYAVLSEAGVRRTDYETTSTNTMLKRPDWEEIGELDGDILLFVVVSGIDPAPDDALAKQTQANPLWQKLPAVRANRVHRVGRATWMGFHGIASAHRVLDDIERHVLSEP